MMKLPAFMMSVMSDLRDLVSARATRSAVELAIWVTRRSTMIAWLSSTAADEHHPHHRHDHGELDGRHPLARLSSGEAARPRGLQDR